jgi:hypothetical protein
MTGESLELSREYPPEGEELQIEQILTVSKFSMERKPHPPTRRDQHPKSHGYLQGELIVEENIADDFKVGVFAKPKTYPIWIRFSNGGSDRDRDGNFLPDTTGDIRGMAIKLTAVEGTMAIDDPAHQGEQDFILMNNPTFFIKDVLGYLDFFPVIDAIKHGKITFNPDRTPKEIPPDLLSKFQAISYAFPLVQRIKAKVTPSPLEVPYWSATPYRLGDRAIKFSVVPHHTGESFNPDNATNTSNYLREVMTTHLATQDAGFDFKIQLQTDAMKMKIEDPTIEWDEQISPFVKVATIRIPQQDFNTEKRKQLDENQSFSPWNSLVEHQPLGGVNRARKIYVKLAKIRNNINLVQKFFSCYQNHDFQGMHHCLAENIKFSDFAYDIQGVQVKAMWHLFCISYLTRTNPVNVPEFEIGQATEDTVSAKYRVSYVYEDKPVDYFIEADFKIQDNKIVEQKDKFGSISTFEFIKMAFGFPLQLLAVEPLDRLLRVLINKKVMEKLDRFMKDNGYTEET